jgi:hypothetical protein
MLFFLVSIRDSCDSRASGFGKLRSFGVPRSCLGRGLTGISRKV